MPNLSTPHKMNDYSETDRLRGEFLKETVDFSVRFIKAAGIPDERAEKIQALIVGRTSELLSLASVWLSIATAKNSKDCLLTRKASALRDLNPIHAQVERKFYFFLVHCPRIDSKNHLR